MPKEAVKAPGAAGPKKTRPVGMQKSLHDKLVLVRWALNELGIETMENLVAPMKSESLEGVAADGETRFLKEIVKLQNGMVGIKMSYALKGYTCV